MKLVAIVVAVAATTTLALADAKPQHKLDKSQQASDEPKLCKFASVEFSVGAQLCISDEILLECMGTGAWSPSQKSNPTV